ncbi:hypothetical protein AXK11_00665 [Cephaloticoccus primus]|uniref:Uncharacterized protein n=1 Tax=Cephaloticoccus primus TaxID=1548207 RepID=A0A139SM34_9BACT|nr:hypothetical protein [Cephaloticoccus primus]KXU35592.1 hypothetical protein AXK11_00665 [Cephaloticoccus primus]
MKKIHVLFPLIAMILFFGYWWNYNKQYEAAQEAKKEQAQQALIAKREQEARDRELAIKLAIEKQAEQRREREAREAKRQQEREERQAAREARERADRERQKLRRQSELLDQDIVKETEAVTKLEERKQFLLAEERFLRDYVRLAESNEGGVTEAIQRIAAAEAARAAAAAEAAQANRR